MTAIRRHHIRVLLALFAGLTAGLLLPTAARAQARTTDLVQASFQGFQSCSKWTPVGACFWLRCRLFRCSVRTSIKVRHYAPDLAVSTFHAVSTHPWSDYGRQVEQANMTLAQRLIGGLDQAGTRSDNRNDRTDKNNRFRDADAIGHPVAAMPNLFAGLPFACPQVAVRPFQPYMLTPTDGMTWRYFVSSEMLYPASWLPGQREIGNWPRQTWGNVFPRTGWAVQQHEVKHSAIVAQRVGDVVTRTGQPHVYTAVRTGGTTTERNYRVWLPPELTERNGSSGTWQMQYPKVTGCVVFGDDDTLRLAEFGDNQTSSESGYIWALWRPYRCCKKEGQIFLGSFGD